MRHKKRLAGVCTAAALLGVLATAPAQAAPTLTPSRTASVQAYTCTFSVDIGQAYVYAGHYNGTTVVPSSVSVTAAGIEAQCLLRTMGFDPGTIDGIFGRNSKAAMRDFQQTVNSRANASLAVDGLPGPQSWPWIRSWAYKGP